MLAEPILGRVSSLRPGPAGVLSGSDTCGAAFNLGCPRSLRPFVRLSIQTCNQLCRKLSPLRYTELESLIKHLLACLAHLVRASTDVPSNKALQLTSHSPFQPTFGSLLAL